MIWRKNWRQWKIMENSLKKKIFFYLIARWLRKNFQLKHTFRMYVYIESRLILKSERRNVNWLTLFDATECESSSYMFQFFKRIERISDLYFSQGKQELIIFIACLMRDRDLLFTYFLNKRLSPRRKLNFSFYN